MLSLDQTYDAFKLKYLASTDNIFEAINLWVHDATELKFKHQNRISNNEALSSCLTSLLPENLDKRIPVKDSEKIYADRYIKESLSQIDDAEIKVSVLRTLDASIFEKNLTFVYLETLTNSQKARVRIISRLIWYNLYPEKGN